jgi:hypothetical protein
MATLGCTRMPREVVIQVCVPRAGNVAALIGCATGRRIRERETAIHDDPIGSAEVARQSVDVDERTECHGDIVASHGSLAPELLESPA